MAAHRPNVHLQIHNTMTLKNFAATVLWLRNIMHSQPLGIAAS